MLMKILTEKTVRIFYVVISTITSSGLLKILGTLVDSLADYKGSMKKFK